MSRARPTSRSPLAQLVLCRLREYYREPAALFWAFGFPILLAMSLGVAFKAHGPEPTLVAVENAPGGARLQADLDHAGSMRTFLLDPTTAAERLRTGKVAVVVAPAEDGRPLTYDYDPARPESRLARLLVDDALQRAAGRTDPRPTRIEASRAPGSRYIDFLIPGLIGMNLMSTSMWGIGWALVFLRTRKVLKLLAATPMRRADFLLAHMLARLAFVVVEVGALLLFGVVVFDLPVRGSLGALAVLSLVGSLSFSGLGLLVASRTASSETVSGLMNLVMLPMFMLSGVFFSSAHFPEAAQPFIRLLPLTALNDALRAVLLDGAPLSHLGAQLANLAAWGAASFALALRMFRWR